MPKGIAAHIVSAQANRSCLAHTLPRTGSGTERNTKVGTCFTPDHPRGPCPARESQGSQLI